jgi:hypothetical protein
MRMRVLTAGCRTMSTSSKPEHTTLFRLNLPLPLTSPTRQYHPPPLQGAQYVTVLYVRCTLTRRFTANNKIQYNSCTVRNYETTITPLYVA